MQTKSAEEILDRLSGETTRIQEAENSLGKQGQGLESRFEDEYFSAFTVTLKQLGILAMTTEPARKTSLENKHLHYCDYFCDYVILFSFYNVNEEPCNWISLSAVKVNTKN